MEFALLCEDISVYACANDYGLMLAHLLTKDRLNIPELLLLFRLADSWLLVDQLYSDECVPVRDC